VESLVAFTAVVLATNATGISTRWTVVAATLCLAARVVHALAYSAGVTIVRSSACYAGCLERFSIGWNHPVDKKSLSFQRSGASSRRKSPSTFSEDALATITIAAAAF
jgi:hypothetical protein